MIRTTQSNEPQNLGCGVNPVCFGLFGSLAAAYTFPLPFSATQAFFFCSTVSIG